MRYEGGSMKGVNLNLKETERIFIEEAIESFVFILPPAEKPFYLLTLNELSKSAIYVDGMFMRCMEIALRYKVRTSRSKLIRNYCSTLEEKIRLTREIFQKGAINIS